MNYKELIDIENSVEVRRARDRLYHRLKKFGYHLEKGKTVTPDDRIQLKRVPTQRGFRITNLATGVIEAGNKFNTRLTQVNKIWNFLYGHGTGKQMAGSVQL